MFLPHPRVKLSIVESFRDREVAFSALDRLGSNFESCVWRTVSSHSAHHPQEVLLAQFSLYVHNGGLKPDSFHLKLLLSKCWKYFSEICAWIFKRYDCRYAMVFFVNVSLKRNTRYVLHDKLIPPSTPTHLLFLSPHIFKCILKMYPFPLKLFSVDV